MTQISTWPRVVTQSYWLSGHAEDALNALPLSPRLIPTPTLQVVFLFQVKKGSSEN